MTIALLISLLSTGAVAQRYGFPAPANHPQQPRHRQPGYGQPDYRQPGYDQSGYDQPGYGQSGYNYDYNDYQFDRHLDWWDRELNLNRRQEREIRRIRARFEQQAEAINVRDPRQRDAFRQLRQREFFDMMAVLDSRQRERVIEHMRPYERVAGRGPGRGRGYGNGNGYGPNRY